ncbi:hypothetical protein [Frigoriglobus tundricola]|uniref:Uncharacterized protein n=1 Tax=Frigoriglobus tundricola TaxID=2774151 RepID=A0A6M5Z3U0_9BACT|nr:hypothetical protein [Frigoriglobus tundricola]QJX00134.1 hypothetical protein FTUN_7758 [Frigoriglobus tundricola]
MRFRWLAAVALSFLATGIAHAQPNATGPAVEVRVRSVNDLVDKFGYVAGLAGKEDVVAQVREMIKQLTADGKGIEGIDPKKPTGAYATLTKDIEATPFVILVPIADEEQFLKALKTRLDVTPEKADDGTLKVAVPFINALHLRFTNGYLYVSQKVEGLDAKALITPKAFFAKDDGAVASVVVHVDRVPDDLKTLFLGQFELSVNEERKKSQSKQNAIEKKSANLVVDAGIGAVKGLIEDGQELSVKVFADPKSDELSAEVTLTAKSGTATAKNITALGRKTSLPAGIVGAGAASVARGNVSVAVTDGMKKDYADLIDLMLAEALKNPPGGQEELAKQLVGAIGPTLKSGELDASSAFIGPDAKGQYQVIAAFAVKEGKGIEKLLKDVVKQFGPMIEQAGTVKFDVETVGNFSLHSFELQNVDDKLDKVFGTKTIWLAISDTCIAFSVEPDGATIRKGLKAKAVPVPVVSGDLAVAKFLPLVRPDLKPDELKALIKDAFGDSPPGGKDTVKFSLEGGKQLSVKFVVKGKAIKMGAGLDLLKGK